STGEIASCNAIAGANKQEYTPVEADVGHELRAQETASNAGGPGPAATSEPTSRVKGTFGKANIGASSDAFASGRKRVNKYAMASAGAVTQIEIYLAPVSGKTGQQVMKGIIYADSSGSPGTLLGVT